MVKSMSVKQKMPTILDEIGRTRISSPLNSGYLKISGHICLLTRFDRVIGPSPRRHHPDRPGDPEDNGLHAINSYPVTCSRPGDSWPGHPASSGKAFLIPSERSIFILTLTRILAPELPLTRILAPELLHLQFCRLAMGIVICRFRMQKRPLPDAAPPSEGDGRGEKRKSCLSSPTGERVLFRSVTIA